MKHLFVINPAAGKGRTLKHVPGINKAFDREQSRYEVRVTEKPGHATDIAREYSHQNSLRIYSVGGDGTLNEILNGMMGSTSSLAVIPSGSGNDFIKSINSSGNLDNIVQRTVNGTEMQIDVGKVNNKYFINIASLGFDAEVAYNTFKLKKLPGIPGSIAYLLGIFITLFNYRNYDLEVSIDNESISGKFLLIAVANGKYYGGGMLPTPEAKLDDGVFDVCLIREMTTFKILRLFPRFIKGRHANIKGVSFHKGREIKIKSNTDIALNIDGEIEHVREAKFEILPKGIRVVIPAE